MADTPFHSIEEPLAELERILIDEYIRLAGHDPNALRSRDDHVGRTVLCQAATHAAMRLTEVEARLHYLRGLRGQE
jgi:hypothetical protein